MNQNRIQNFEIWIHLNRNRIQNIEILSLFELAQEKNFVSLPNNRPNTKFSGKAYFSFRIKNTHVKKGERSSKFLLKPKFFNQFLLRFIQNQTFAKHIWFSWKGTQNLTEYGISMYIYITIYCHTTLRLESPNSTSVGWSRSWLCFSKEGRK